MSLLDLVYEARKGRAAGDVPSLSSDLRLELLSLTLVAPLCFTNIRAETSDTLYAVDASDAAVAACLQC